MNDLNMFPLVYIQYVTDEGGERNRRRSDAGSEGKLHRCTGMRRRRRRKECRRAESHQSLITAHGIMGGGRKEGREGGGGGGGAEGGRLSTSESLINS